MTQNKSPDSNVEAVREKMLTRSVIGLAKYGVTTERDDLSMLDWLNHLQQELMDAAIYAECLIQRIQNSHTNDEAT